MLYTVLNKIKKNNCVPSVVFLLRSTNDFVVQYRLVLQVGEINFQGLAQNQ